MKVWTAEELRAQKVEIFATYDDINDVLDLAKRTDNGATATQAVMIAMNTMLENLAKALEE